MSQSISEARGAEHIGAQVSAFLRARATLSKRKKQKEIEYEKREKNDTADNRNQALRNVSYSKINERLCLIRRTLH